MIMRDEEEKKERSQITTLMFTDTSACVIIHWCGLVHHEMSSSSVARHRHIK